MTLPEDVYCHIKLKDKMKTFTTQSYSTSQKYKEATRTSTHIMMWLDIPIQDIAMWTGIASLGSCDVYCDFCTYR
jgi:hypothetical protein